MSHPQQEQWNRDAEQRRYRFSGGGPLVEPLPDPIPVTSQQRTYGEWLMFQITTAQANTRLEVEAKRCSTPAHT